MRQTRMQLGQFRDKQPGKSRFCAIVIRADRQVRSSSEALFRFYQDLHVVDGGVAVEREREIDVDDVTEP